MLKTALALLSRGAMLDFSDQDGNTPLHDACLAGHADIVVSLLPPTFEEATAPPKPSTLNPGS